MATNKKSFILYCDIISTIEKLPNDLAGKLFKHILNYVNDNDPKLDDLLLEIAFEPIKQSLKRDLKKYEKLQETARLNGSRGGRPKNPEKAKESQKTQPVNLEPRKAVSVSDSVSEDQKIHSEHKRVDVHQERVPFKKITDLWNSKMLPHLPEVKSMTKTREGHIRQRWNNNLTDMQNWENFFEYILDSPFLMGKVAGRNGGKPFRASFDWVIKPANYVKILEGHYHE